MNLNAQTITWLHNRQAHSIRLQPGKIYVQPNGYKIEMCKHPGAPSWRLVGTKAEGTFCHKPCTVSGGGKSEISKSIEDAVIYAKVTNLFDEVYAPWLSASATENGQGRTLHVGTSIRF